MRSCVAAWHLAFGATAAILLAAAVPTAASAGSEDAVAVLPAAGTDRAVVYSLAGAGDDLQAERTGQRRLVAGDLAPSAFSAMRILPAGGQLLTDFDDRGVATTDETGALDFALGGPGEHPGIPGAAVVGFEPDGRPVQFLYGDDDQRRLVIHDRRADTDLWSTQILTPNAPAEIAQVAALPGHRIAAAIEWPSRQLSAVDIYDLSADRLDRRSLRLANTSHDAAPDPTVELSPLDGLRDIFGLGDERLLVTTRTDLLVISLDDREITRRLSLDDREQLAGEFVSARRLPSGRIAAATIEPGLWTEAHPNHRLLWFDAELDDLLAEIAPLERAPWRLDAAGGHGASGTRGLEPDLEFVPAGSLEDIRVASGVDVQPDPVRAGTTAHSSVHLSVGSEWPTYLDRVAVTASPDGCEHDAERKRLAERVEIAVSPTDDLAVEGTFRLDAEAPAGEWCTRVDLQAPREGSRSLSSTTSFEVVSPEADVRPGTGNTVEPVDLDLQTSDAGPRGDAAGGPPGGLDDTGGCGCRATGPALPGGVGPAWMLWLLAGLGLRRRG